MLLRRRHLTPAVTGAFVVSAASEKCVRVDGIVMRLLPPTAGHAAWVCGAIDHGLPED